MHGFGLNNSITTLSFGGTIVLNDRGSFDGDCAIDLIERHRVSSLCLVGDAMSLPLLDVLDRSTERRELSSVRLIISAGVFWSAEVKSRLLAYFGKARLLDLLASSEAIGTGSARSSADLVAGSARFTPGPFTKVVTEGGEFVAPGSGLVGRLVTGGRLSVGYFKDDAKSAATFLELDGRRWSASGDLATVEADGIIRLMGRETLVINSGGEKIHPEEVEIALRTHPSVSDAVVVGLPDDRFGQVLVGLVQMNSDQEFDESQIRDHVRRGLAAYKVPRHLIRVESVGRGANGKVEIRSHIDHAQQAIRSA
jgi:acyl-CoA synthetase (AMP-forming)/AMP-acid ligase II